MVDRRKHVRRRPLWAKCLSVRWRHDDAEIMRSEGAIGDISMGGCCAIVNDAPAAGAAIAVSIDAGGSENGGSAAFVLIGRVISSRPHAGQYRCAIEFAPGQHDKKVLLRKHIFSTDYVDVAQEASASAARASWGLDQWAVFLTEQPLPVLPYSKHLLAALCNEDGEKDLSIAEIAGVAVNDPFLVLMLLRAAGAHKAGRLSQGVSTVLAAVMRLGVNGVKQAIMESPVVDDENPGLIESSETAILAGRLARAWAACRYDVNVEEVVLATLLTDIGEQMLWHVAPEIPLGVYDAMKLKKITSYETAQMATCGFKFHDLTLQCVTQWDLATPLIRGAGSMRAAIPRLAVSIARHIRRNGNVPALRADLDLLASCIPGVSRRQLVQIMNDVAGIDFHSPENVNPMVHSSAAYSLMPSGHI